MNEILITGFEGYGGRSDNPSAAIAEALSGREIAGHRLNTRVLPVTNHDIRENITSLIDELKPRAVLSLGLAPGEKMIRIERVAANYSHFEINDNSGQRYTGVIEKDGPQAYATTLPVEDMLAAVHECSIPAYLSNTAGTFLCNAVMYHALHYCSEQNLDIACGFVHLPYLPSQVCDLLTATVKSSEVELHQRSDLASMSLEVQLAAVGALLKRIIDGE
ncbi:hypothetical protein AB833_19115 [Chromatiales bacterium (ex Bugula neritina AB1)]|nr:hypothetical protein AB833_19115 [Chromatiales bacterium (ex Bugula neritina AB1)]